MGIVCGVPVAAQGPATTHTPSPSPQVRSSGATPQHRIDSVRALLRAHPTSDTTQVLLLSVLADEITVVDVRAAGPTRRAACQLARRLGYRDFLAEALLNMADYHIALAEYGPALPLLRESQAEFTRLHDLGGQMRCLGRRSRIADQRGQLAEALSYCLRAMAMSSTGDQRRFHTSLKIHAASIYTRLGEYEQARTYLQEALAVARYHEYPDRINLIMGELGDLNRSQGQWAEARRYYGLSIAVSRRIVITDQATVRTMRFNLADVTERLGDYTQALPLAQAALREAATAHDVPLVPRALVLLGRTWLHLNQPDSALHYANRGLLFSQKAHSLEGLRAAYDVLARAHAQRKNWATAYLAQLRFNTYDDSLTGTNVSRRTAALRFNHEVNQHRAQLLLLGQEQELGRLRQQRQTAGMLALVLLVGLGGAALLWRYRQRQRHHETALRNRLAADLRDDVGTLLSRISLQSGLLQEGLAESVGHRQQLGQISDASHSAVRQLNDVVWSLDAHNDHLPALLDRMHTYAHDVLGTAGLAVDFEFPEESSTQWLPVLLRRNIYLIYKESLHNILEHATGATTVVVRVRLETGNPAQLVLEIVDDGTGAATAPDGHARRSGHGLRNIQTRAQALGGAATSDGAPGGFRVCVVVPLPSAWKVFGRTNSPAA